MDYVDDYLFDGEYLLISEDGENLRSRSTPIAFMASGQFWANNHAHVVRGNLSANSKFLCYALAIADVSGYLTGSTQPKLTKQALDSIALLLPDVTEQEAIARMLGALDDKIAMNERTAASEQQLAREIVRQALNAETVTHLIDDISELISRGIPPKYDDSPSSTIVLNQKCIRNSRVGFGPARRTSEASLRPQKVLKFGDALVNSTGYGTLGRVARWTSQQVATVDSHVSIVRFDPARVDVTCAGHAMLAMESTIEALAEGSTGQTELPRASLASLAIKVPLVERQEQLGKLLSSLDALADNYLRSNIILAALRDTLLPALLSGRLRVRDAEKIVEDAI